MNVLLPALLLFHFGNLVARLWGVHRGLTAAARMLSALLIGPTSVAAVLLLAEWQQLPALRVAALLFVMLAAVISIAYAAAGCASCRRWRATRRSSARSCSCSG